MNEETLNKAEKIYERICGLEQDIKDLKYCHHTLGITHWGNCDISYNTYIEVSNDIINAIIAEMEKELKSLKEQFESL